MEPARLDFVDLAIITAFVVGISCFAIGYAGGRDAAEHEPCPKHANRVTTRTVSAPTLILQDGIWRTERHIEQTEMYR